MILRSKVIVTLWALGSSLLPVMQGATAASSQLSGEYDPRRVIVTFSDLGNAADNASLQARAQGRVESTESRAISPMTQNVRLLTLGRNVTVPDAIARLKGQPGILSVEPDFKVYALGQPTDPYFTNTNSASNLWGMYAPEASSFTSNINAFGTGAATAWSRGFTGSSTVAVGVIDEGIQITHPDLAANIWVNPGETAGDGIDNDGNGFKDDVNGWDFFNNDKTVYDGSITNTSLDAHGTHVSGTIGARSDGAGVVGVNWDVKIISAKFLGANGGSTSGAIAAVRYLTDLKLRGAPIVAINNSWGGGGFSQALLDAINAAGDAGILFIAAAGNSASNNDSVASYPSNYNCTTATRTWDCVVAVASIDKTGALSSFSSYGARTVDLGAPGSGIWSSVPFSTWANYSGTSMATPHVTGAAALCAAAGANSAKSIRDAITSSVRPLASLSGKTVSGGTLDINAMVSLCSNGLQAQAPVEISNITTSIPANSAVTLTASGGSGDGAYSFQLATSNSLCAISGAILTVSQPTSCAVVAKRAASGSYVEATSPSKTFTFNALAQNSLTLSPLSGSTNKSGSISLTVSGGSGSGAVTFAASSTCTVSQISALTAAVKSRNNKPTTCTVMATKAASGYFSSVTSSMGTYTFR